MPASEKLLAALRELAGHRKRVLLDDVWRAFGRALPSYGGDVEARPRLSALAVAADGWLASRGLRLSPATRWYRELPDRAEDLAMPGKPRDVSTRCLEWIPAEFRDRAGALLAAGYRAPQELVGWERLAAALP